MIVVFLLALIFPFVRLQPSGDRIQIFYILFSRQTSALLQLFLSLLSVLAQPIEPGAALKIGAVAAQLIAPLPGADPDGAVGRAAAISASGAAGVDDHPVQGPVHRGPVDGLSSGHEGRPHGDLAVADVLSGAGRAVRCRDAP